MRDARPHFGCAIIMQMAGLGGSDVLILRGVLGMTSTFARDRRPSRGVELGACVVDM